MYIEYYERLQTFEGFWDDHKTTARQLAAIGHVCDRPPLELLEDGSRCTMCSISVRKELSIKALEGSGNSSNSYEDGFKNFTFHHPGCILHQIRIPLDPQAMLAGLHGHRIEDLKRRFERQAPTTNVQTSAQRAPRSSSLFSLPVEIRLEIYSMILPSLDAVTEIVTLNRASSRVITAVGYQTSGPRDTTRPNILRTCRAVNEEAMDLLYSKTTFQFGSTKVMYFFLRSIGSTGRQLVKSIDIHCGGREDAISFALLASCDNLKVICIRLPRATIFFPRAPLWFNDGVACLLALSGLEDVRFGSCAPSVVSMSDQNPDGAIIRRQLSRPKGSPVLAMKRNAPS